MNGRQIFSIHIVLKCQRSSEAQTFARLQHFCTFVIEIKDRMQYCMEKSKRGCRARALGIGTRLLYALRAALRAARAGVIKGTMYCRLCASELQNNDKEHCFFSSQNVHERVVNEIIERYKDLVSIRRFLYFMTQYSLFTSYNLDIFYLFYDIHMGLYDDHTLQ